MIVMMLPTATATLVAMSTDIKDIYESQDDEYKSSDQEYNCYKLYGPKFKGYYYDDNVDMYHTPLFN